MERVFVVGCPRSGTTLVQAMLARHPDVFSLPETYFFQALLGEPKLRWQDRGARSARKWYHRRGLARSWGRRRLRHLESLVSLPRRMRPTPWRWTACVRQYVELLDGAATRGGCSCWAEKTPVHVLYLDEIRQSVPNARIVHVLRRGLDTIASIVDADLHWDTDAFSGGIAQWAHRWNRAMALHLQQLGDPCHYLLCMEDLMDDPAGEWAKLRDFLHLDRSKPLACRPCVSVADVRAEPWKKAAATGVVRRVSSKASTLFGRATLAWLQQNLADYDAIRAAVRDNQGRGQARSHVHAATRDGVADYVALSSGAAGWPPRC